MEKFWRYSKKNKKIKIDGKRKDIIEKMYPWVTYNKIRL